MLKYHSENRRQSAMIKYARFPICQIVGVPLPVTGSRGALPLDTHIYMINLIVSHNGTGVLAVLPGPTTVCQMSKAELPRKVRPYLGNRDKVENMLIPRR